MKNIDATHLNQSIDNKSFIETIQHDKNVAMRIASENDLKFRSDLLAVYHYHKHGEEFASIMSHQQIDVYLTQVPEGLIQDANLIRNETVNNSNGSYLFTRKYYITPEDHFAIVIESPEGGQMSKNISTMFQNGGSYEKFTNGFTTQPDNFPFIIEKGNIANINPINLAVHGITDQIAKDMQFRGLYQIIINVNSYRFEVNFDEE